MADKQSTEKQALLRAYGAEVVLCPTNVAPEFARELLQRGRPAGTRHPEGIQARPVLERGEPRRPRTDDRPRAVGRDRWSDHPFCRERGHRWDDLRGRARAQERNPAIQVIGADPEGSILSGHGTAVPDRRIGEDFLPGTYDPSAVDRWIRVSDRDAFAMARRLTREEGILAGGSCGTAMVAASEVVRDLMATEGGRCGRRGAAAGQRPQLPLQGLQRRMDARQRADGHDRRRDQDRGFAG